MSSVTSTETAGGTRDKVRGAFAALMPATRAEPSTCLIGVCRKTDQVQRSLAHDDAAFGDRDCVRSQLGEQSTRRASPELAVSIWLKVGFSLWKVLS